MPRLILPLSPGTNRMYRHGRGKTYKSEAYQTFRDEVLIAALQAGLAKPTDGQFSVSIYYHPKGRKKETDKPLRRLDVDAHTKPVLDSLQGIAYHDDYQVVRHYVEICQPMDVGQLVVMWEAA
jgi:Holliday junction resolvase RusA-like endonuclease